MDKLNRRQALGTAAAGIASKLASNVFRPVPTPQYPPMEGGKATKGEMDVVEETSDAAYKAHRTTQLVNDLTKGVSRDELGYGRAIDPAAWVQSLQSVSDPIKQIFSDNIYRRQALRHRKNYLIRELYRYGGVSGLIQAGLSIEETLKMINDQSHLVSFDE